jgi:hypothetical protein
MTVKEMHVDIRSQVQRLSANRNRKLEDDHIDWYANICQQMMIESAVEPVLGSGRYRIKPTKHGVIAGLTVNRLSLSAAWRGEKYMSILPSDFWYLLDDGSRVTQLCKGDTKTIGYEVLNITRVPFPYSALTTGYYKDVQLSYSGNSVFNINTLLSSRQKIWNGLPAADAHFYVRDLLIQELTKLGLKVYWENFDTFSYPFHLIFVSTGSSTPISLTVDGNSYAGINQELTTEIHRGSRQSVLSPNTMVSSDKEMATAVTPYFKTSYISPVSEKGNGVIYTHANESYIVYNTAINYIRKPAQISLSLGTNCELSADMHQQLCNTTAEMIANRIGDDQWKSMTEQNKIINP